MLRKAWIALALCSFISPPVFSQNPTPPPQRNRANDYSIRGKLILPNNHDADRIEVKLEKTFGQPLQVAYTDGAGNFDFRGLSVGSYYVIVNLDGYEPVRQTVDIVNVFGSSSLTIFLQKPAVTIKDHPVGLDADDPDVVDVSQMKENLPKKAVQDYEKAIEEKQKGRIESAVKLLEDAIRIAPNFFHAHNNLGILYLSAKRYPEAEKEFQRSRDLNAKTDRPLVNLGKLYIEEAGLQGNSQGDSGKLLDEALDALEQAVKLNPRSAVGYFYLGQANYRSSFLEEAEAAFKKAHQLDPNMVVARLMLSNVYVKEEKWDLVIENLDAYLRENPKATDRAQIEAVRSTAAHNLEHGSGKQ
jgi:tetratricopeptide (TPR) repeat protein